MMVVFCSIVGWSCSGWWMWDLRTFAQFKGSEVPPGLFQEFMDGHIHFFNFVPGVTQENDDAGLV